MSVRVRLRDAVREYAGLWIRPASAAGFMLPSSR